MEKKLVKVIKDAGGKYDDYLIYTKIRQILLHWDYELTEKDIFINSTSQCIKMSYYWFNRKEILQKAIERYSKKSFWVLLTKQRSNKRKVKESLQNLSKEEKHKIKEYQGKRCQQLIQYKKETLQNK